MAYRVYRGYSGRKCIRRFDSLDDAQMWCWSRDRVDPYRIEWTEPATKDRPERKMRQFI
jgi:hypothetical protein